MKEDDLCVGKQELVSRFRFHDLGFGVGFGVQGLKFRVKGLGVRAEGLAFRVKNFKVKVKALGF